MLELSGVAALDLRAVLVELDGMGAASRSSRTLYHASINTPVVEQLNPEQQRQARERLAEVLGLAGQAYVVVEHVKHGRQHTHVVWSRIDQETGKAIPDAHNYRKHEVVSRELEHTFGHAHVLGAHVRDKDRDPRPGRGPSWGEQRQAERSGMTPQEARRVITACWQQTKTGQEFQARLAAEGFALARGDRRDFVLVDGAGEIHGLTRRIEGGNAKDIRQRLAGIDAAQLPSVADVRAGLQHTQEKGFTSAVERLRDEERREGTAAPALLSGFNQEAANAIWQLNKTMRSQIEATIPGTRRPEAAEKPKLDLYEEARRRAADKARGTDALDELRRSEERRRRPERDLSL